MTVTPLYTGSGVSLSPQNVDGRILSDYVRLIADTDKAITNGTITITCIDVQKADVDSWIDCALPEQTDTEATTEDLYNALAELGVS